MSHDSRETLELLGQLVDAAARPDAIRALTSHLGAEVILIFIRDPEVKVFLPAPGFPQTLPDGRAWQDFLVSCANGQLRRGSLTCPDRKPPRAAVGIGYRGEAAVVLLGGQPAEAEVRKLGEYLPLLYVALRGELAVALRAAEVQFAHQLARQASELTTAVDEARRAAQQELVARKRAEAEVRELNETLERRVEERTALLKRALEQMEEFSYTVSHDLRSPLRAIQGYAQVVLADYGADLQPEASRHLERILSASGRLDRLTQDVLCYARVARTDLELVPVHLNELIPSIIEEYNLRANGASIDVQSPLASVRGNEALIAQCVANLVGNAVKFVPPHLTPEIRLWTETHGTRVRLSVQDNGVGIPPDSRDRIFKLFERLDSRQPGTGLGLAIVRRAAERMSGSVGLESTPGSGSTFWIELPMLTP